jgi:ATP-dependent helicase/nuclease subunit A
MSAAFVLTEAQRRAAEPTSSVWVSASAGTGKTQVLIARVLALLLTGATPHRLLCLTFTKAAAAEMSARLAEKLGAWATADDPMLDREIREVLGRPPKPDERQRAPRLFATVLDAPGGLKIQTLHAFCQALLGRFPLEARVPPYFQLADDRTQAEMWREARDSVLLQARDGGPSKLAAALAEVTRHASEATFGELMQAVADERGRLIRALSAHGLPGVIERIHRRLGSDPRMTAEGIAAAAVDADAMDAAGLGRAAKALAKGTDSDRRRAVTLEDFLAQPQQRTANFDTYRLLFLTADGGVRQRLATEAAKNFDPAVEAILRREAQRLLEVDRRIKAKSIADATAALTRLGAAMLESYERWKRAHAALDYDDLILKTRDLLQREGTAPWVLYKLDGGIDHILIDEAQDTNPEQWQVVRALAEEFFAGTGARDVDRTVFAVGDVKQSIFSFQRADPQGFVDMHRYFRDRAAAAGKGWEDVELTTSFRSTEPVLAAVDRVFRREPARLGVVEPGHELRHQARRRGQAGRVELWPSVEPQDLGPLEPWRPPVSISEGDDPPTRLAEVIARTVRRWLDTGERLPSKDRRIRAGDIMVLVRRRGSFVESLVRALKNQGVPVAGVDRMVLTEQLAVMDLIALGQVLLLPEDDLTLATVLKGPIVGLDEERLFRLAHDRGDVRLWQRLRERRDEPGLTRAWTLLSDLRALADFVPPYELFGHILGPREGRRRIVSQLGIEALDPIDEFLSAALAYERQHASSLQGFLAWLAQGRVEIKRDLERSGRDEVRVMTVHGAKGLEAPIVFLPDTMDASPRIPALFWPARDLGQGDDVPLWSPRRDMDDPVAESCRNVAKRKRDEEYRRLLYVAMTRASDRLIVSGWRGRRPIGPESWYGMVASGLDDAPRFDSAELKESDIQGWGRLLERAQDAEAETQDRAAEPTPAAAKDLPAWATAPAPLEPEPPTPLAPSRPEVDEPTVLSPLAADDSSRYRRGRLVHRLLQSLPDLPRRRRRTVAKRWLSRRVHGLDGPAVEAMIEETLAVIDEPRFAPLFRPGSRAEVPIVGLIGRHVVAGQVDRLAVGPGRVLIVDYKTGRPAPSRADDASPVYLRQLAVYRAVLRKIYPGHQVEAALLWTDGPTLLAIDSAILDRHEPRPSRNPALP